MSLTCTLLGAAYTDSFGGVSGGPVTINNSGGNFSFVNGKWYICGILVTASSSANLRTPVLSGGTSGTWTAKGTLSFATIAANTMRANWHYFKATSSFSETLTCTVTGSSLSSLIAIIVELNSDPAGSLLVGGGPNTNTGRGDAGTTATPTALSSFADATNNGTLLIVGKTGTGAITAGSGMTVVAQASITAIDCRLGILFRTGQDTAPTATFSSADWYAGAAEINKDASSAIAALAAQHNSMLRG